MATKGFSFGIHNRTRSSVSTSLKKVGSKTFNQGCRQLVLLLQERQLADDGGVLCFAAAYLEEADDAHDEENCNADSAGNRHNERESKHSGNEKAMSGNCLIINNLLAFLSYGLRQHTGCCILRHKRQADTVFPCTNQQFRTAGTLSLIHI